MVPIYTTPGSAGADLHAIADDRIEPGEYKTIPTGVMGADVFGADDVGVAALILPRSGLAAKRGVTVLNAPGLIDSDYTGEIKVALINHSRMPFTFFSGDRIAQIMMVRYLHNRNWFVGAQTRAGGFGSTGGFNNG